MKNAEACDQHKICFKQDINNYNTSAVNIK